MRGCGVDVASASIRHLDAKFTLLREGDYDGLFADTCVDGLVEPLIAGRPEIVAAARDTLLGEEPVREMGAHCDAPFPCSYKGHCGRDLPPGPEWPVWLLPDAAGKKIARAWAGQGVADLTQVPAEAMTGAKLARVHAATLTGVPHHDPAAIAAETCGWRYPRTFLDFETIQFAIPRWVGTRPYQHVPFQFSAHIVQADGNVSHSEYLSFDGGDPRRGCAEALARLPRAGAVVAWNAGFERTCLLTLAVEFPDLADAL